MVSYIKGSKKMSGQLIAQNFDISTHPIVFIITEFKFEINDHMFSEHFLGPWFHLFWLAVWAVECRDLSWLCLGEIQFWVFIPIMAQNRHIPSSWHHILSHITFDFLSYIPENNEFVHLGHPKFIMFSLKYIPLFIFCSF